MRSVLLSCVIFAITFVVYFESKDVRSMDSRWTLYVSWSLLRDHDQNLDEFEEIRADQNPYDVLPGLDGHHYWMYPLGTPLLVLPGVWLVDHWFARLVQKSSRVRRFVEKRSNRPLGPAPDVATLRMFLERLFAAAIAAACCLAWFWLARQRTTLGIALFVTLLFAFGTSMWSTTSRGLWQHGPSVLMLLLTLHCLVAAQQRPWFAGLAALPLAFAYICRPSNAISVVFLSLFVLIRCPRQIARFVLFALPVAVPWCLSNWLTYGALRSPYFATEGWNMERASFLEGIPAQWISTGRGLLVFSPFYAFALWAMVVRDWRQWRSLETFMIAIVVVHSLAVAVFPCWWAGHSYGPRFMTDVLPYLSWFLIYGIERVLRRARPWRTIGLCLLGASSLFATLVHYEGANHHVTYEWNDVPNDIDNHTERLWSLRDPQVLSGWLR